MPATPARLGLRALAQKQEAPKPKNTGWGQHTPLPPQPSLTGGQVPSAVLEAGRAALPPRKGAEAWVKGQEDTAAEEGARPWPRGRGV